MRPRHLPQLIVGSFLVFGAILAVGTARGTLPLDPDTAAAVEATRLDMPEALRPASVDVRVEYAPFATEGGVVARPESWTIVVDERALPLPRSVWAHELAHLAMGAIRADSKEERRLLEVIHEGLADAIAAATTGSPVVGDVREQRDLRAPPRLVPEYWAVLASPAFDPHSAGWALGSELWRAARAHPALLADTVTAIRQYPAAARTSPVAVLSTLVRACPASSRAALGASLAAWSGLDLDENARLP